MKTSTSQLRTLLASRQFYTAALFTFTLADGTVLRYTSGDRDIISGGQTFSAGGASGPFFLRAGASQRVTWKVGTAVSKLQFDVAPGAALVEGAPFLQAVRLGFFRGAAFQYDRAVMPAYGDVSAGTVTMFSGWVGEIDLGRSAVTFNVNAYTIALNKPFPRNVYQAGCLNTLYDTACTLNPAALAVLGVCGSSSTNRVVISNAVLGSSTQFSLGKVVFTSGANAPLSRPVRSYDGVHTITLSYPLPNAPLAGDSFTIYPGCDKTFTRCGQFSNTANFRAQPNVPIAETSI